MLLHMMGGFLNMQSCESPIVTFAFRLNTSFGQLFGFQHESVETPKYLISAKNAVERNGVSKANLTVEKTICSLMLNPLRSLEKLENVYKKLENDSNINVDYIFNLYCMSESLRFFFYIPDKISSRI